MARLRGAQTVIVGIPPDVAFSVVRLGMDLDVMPRSIWKGLDHLESITTGHRTGQSTLASLVDPRAPL